MKSTILVLLSIVAHSSVNAYNCLNDDDCTGEQKCLPGCETNAETPTCGTGCTEQDQECVWSCQVTGNTNPINGNTATCTTTSGSCGSNGECKGVCETPPVCQQTCGTGQICSKICQAPQSGSSRLKLFTPLLVLVTLVAKICFSP